MNPRIPLTCALTLALAGCAGTVGSDRSTASYTADARDVVVRSAYNLCWRTAYWTPASASADCDPDLVPKPAPKPAPVAAPRPAPPVPLAKPAPVPAPVPVAPATAPKPVAAAPKPKRCDAAINLQSDQTFAFDSATLTAAARSRIDRDVLGKLQECASVDLVLVSGHTDRIGSQQYNQRLSERRAAAVKQYLVSKGVPTGKIETMGMGKTVPAKFCPDSRNQKEVIACLAPNRRVEIEIKGPGK